MPRWDFVLCRPGPAVGERTLASFLALPFSSLLLLVLTLTGSGLKGSGKHRGGWDVFGCHRCPLDGWLGSLR